MVHRGATLSRTIVQPFRQQVTHVKPKTRYTITAAHRITGKSRTTLQRHLKSGKLSCTEDIEGNRLIDASELMRVYGEECDFSGVEQIVKNSDTREEGSPATVHHRLNSVQQQLDTVYEERGREREQLQSQIDHLQEALRLAQEGHNRATLLLESRTAGGGEWEASIKSLEEKISNQQVTFEDRVAELRKEARRDAIEEIKEKPWWRVVFG